MGKKGKLSHSVLKKLRTQYVKLKAQKSSIDSDLKVIKGKIMAHFEVTETSSIMVGESTFEKVVSSHSLVLVAEGGKLNDSTQALIRELKERGLDNLLEIKAHKTNLHLLSEKEQSECVDILKKHGLKTKVNYTLQYK